MRKTKNYLLKSFVSFALSAALIMGAVPVPNFTLCAFADVNPEIRYLEWNGNFVEGDFESQECIRGGEVNGEPREDDYEYLSENATLLTDVNSNTTTYVVKGTLNLKSRLEIKGNINIIICNDSTLNAPFGIQSSGGSTLNLFVEKDGTGTIIAGDKGKITEGNAGIGGGNGDNSGNIYIHGVNIIAQGGNNAAGIGGGNQGESGNFVVYAGNITATGGENGAGIGGGNQGGSGNFTIFNGTINATGGEGGAGIGGGDNGSFYPYQVDIWGGEIVAKGGKGGSGIGGGSGAGYGSDYYYSILIIHDGEIKATGGEGGAGIGGGTSGSWSVCYISGGKVTATGGEGGAGIGGGYKGSLGYCCIENGTVTAIGKGGGAGIGGGNAGNAGNSVSDNNSDRYIKIGGGSITAKSEGSGSAIGAGKGGVADKGVSICPDQDSDLSKAKNIILSATITDTNGKVVSEGIDAISNGTKNNNNLFYLDIALFKKSDGNMVIESNDANEFILYDKEFTIPSGKILTVPDGINFIIDSDVTLTNNGTISVEGGGTVTNNGTVNNTNGKISVENGEKAGNFTNNGTLNNTNGKITVDGTFLNTGKFEGTMPTGSGSIEGVFKTMSVAVSDVSVTYDEQPHGIVVSVSDPVKDYSIKYKASKDEENYNLNSSPVITNVKDSPKTIYYQVTAEGYKQVEGSATVTIGKADLKVTANPHKITYGDSPANDGVKYSGFVNNEDESVLGGSLDYDYSYTQYGDVDSYDITPKGLTSDNYELSFIKGTLTVERKEAGLSWDTETQFKYDGNSHCPDVKVTGTVNGDKLSATIKGEITNAGSGTAKVTGLTGDKAGNYKLPETGLTKDFSISKADAQVLSEVTVSALYNSANVKATVSELMPNDAGELKYSVGDATVEGNVNVSDLSVSAEGQVTAALADGAEGDKISIPVTISSTNYEDSTVCVEVALTPKKSTGVTLTPGGTKTMTYGDDALTITASASKEGENGSWKWESDDTEAIDLTTDNNKATVTVKKVCADTVTVKAKYESDTTIGEKELKLTIKPKSFEIPSAAKGLVWTGEIKTGVASKDGYTVTNGQASDAGDYEAIASLQDKENTEWSDGTTEDKSISWSIKRAKGHSAPKGLKGVAPTSSSDNDGKITGVTKDMEYSEDSGFSDASSCSGTTITDLSAGTYYVRYKSDENHETGKSTSVTVPEYIEDTSHVHKPVLVKAKDATDTTDGNKAYYKCSCGKLFWDDLCLKEIKDPEEVIIHAVKGDSGKGKDDNNGDDNGSGSNSSETSSNNSTGNNAGSRSDSSTETNSSRSNSNGNSTGSGSGSSTGGGSGSGSGSGVRMVLGATRTDSSVMGFWKKDEKGWKFSSVNGEAAENTWRLCEYNGIVAWYRFDKDGYIVTGWYLDEDNNLYYLNTDHNGAFGQMLTGWQTIDGKLYYFEVSEGKNQGRLYHNELTPDGYFVDATGAWSGVPAMMR